MATANQAWGSYTTLTTTNLDSLANDTTDPYGAWQSARVDLQSSLKPTDVEILIDVPMANTAPANDQAAYVYVVPWMTTDGGTTWKVGGNFGTTTAPTGSEGTASVSDPNSMVLAKVLPYKVAQQRLQGFINLAACFPSMPDAFSLAIRNCTGAAFSTSTLVAYRSLTQTVA